MEEKSIPWARVAAFVRQHTHDVRNDLNSLDLETELLRDLVTDLEATTSIQSMQKQLRSVAMQLRTLASLFHEVQPMLEPTEARSLLTLWREKHSAMPKAPEVKWVDELGDQEVNVDVTMCTKVLQELLTNAAAFSPGAPLTITAKVEGNDAIFEMVEPKKAPVDPSGWGQPLNTSRHGSYGMGLFAAHRAMAANGAEFTQSYDAENGTLVSRIALGVI
ncbi:MAG: hypothetical protein V4662_18165 [Verrucomicrobiota bacterium]